MQGARAVIALAGASLVAAVALSAVPTAPAAAQGDRPTCADLDLDALAIEGADFAQGRCLDDLTTAGNTFRTTGGGTRQNPTLHSGDTAFPPDPEPGLQVEGWFPDTCDRYEPEQAATFMPTCDNGLRRNGQFVLRVPDDWDGVHLVVAGAPGIRDQYAQDPIISDWVLARGWAYIGHDRGNTGLNFFRAGDDETGGDLLTWLPGAAMEQWAPMMERAALAGADALADLYGTPPSLTYASGASNGGYQTRLALERHPEVFDGGVDWEGTFFTSGPTNPFVYLPPVLRSYTPYRATGDADAYAAIVHEGRMPPDSEPVWEYHDLIYWGATMTGYRPLFDPEYTDYVAAARTPVLPQDPDAQYDYASRPPVVAERIDRIAVDGQINGRPLLTLHGTLDALLPISTASDPYARAVRASGNAANFRYYVVEGATHVDSLADDHPTVIRPLLPCYVEALDALDAWVVDGTPPPPSGFIPFPDTDPVDRANRCPLPPPVTRVAGPDRITTATAGSRGAAGISRTAVLASAGDFPDALTAAPLAAALDAPLLLVGDAVDPAVQRELDRTGALEVVLVGGTAAIGEAVADQLADGGLAVRRVAGADRYATAAAVAAELPAGTTAYVASGTDFADALAIAPVAAAEGAPILLVGPDGVPAATRDALAQRGVTATTVVGGPAAVPQGVLDGLPGVTRIAGPDRYATAAAVVTTALADRPDGVDQVAVADGRDFPDALSAAAVVAAGYGGAAGDGLVLLVDGGADALPGPVAELLAAERDRIRQLLVVGGPAAVGDQLLPALG